MRKLWLDSLVLLSTAMVTACGDQAQSLPYDPALLDTYRNAVPNEQRLSAPMPVATGGARAVGEPAAYPAFARPIVTGVNGAVVSMVSLLNRIVQLPPTYFNNETKEFVWGPWDNDNDFGKVAAYIRENPTKQDGSPPDFKYGFALLRGASEDLTSFQPVIWGGTNPQPDNPEFGSGIILWDFEANYAFAEAFDPDFASRSLARGRFVSLWGKGPDAGNPDATSAFVVAVFRGFVPEDKPDSPPADLDYFFGRVTNPQAVSFSFLDFFTRADINDTPTSVEDLSVRMAFVNDGVGRAEANAENGSLAAGQTVHVDECWDTNLNRTFAQYSLDDNGSVTTSTEGAQAACGGFEVGLDALGVPSLATIEAQSPELMAALRSIAENGLPVQ